MANEFIAKNGLISQNNSTVSGSLTVTQGITGSLFGTASWATHSLTASLAPNYVLTSDTSSMTVATASYATASGVAATIAVSTFGADVDSYLLMSNVLGTTGVGIGGDSDLKYNTSTNKLTVGNISATTLTGSLQGTATSVDVSYVQRLIALGI